MPLKIHVDEDIVLRLRKAEDAQELFDFTDKNRVHLREWLPWLDSNTKIEDTQNFIAECERNYIKGTGLNLVIYFNDKMVGSIGFNTISSLNKSAEIGYMLGKDFLGMGIMTKSCNALVDYGFNELNLNRIVIKVGENNLKSRAIPEKLDFEKEGILKQSEYLYDHYIDIVVYAMLKENWNKK